MSSAIIRPHRCGILCSEVRAALEWHRQSRAYQVKGQAIHQGIVPWCQIRNKSKTWLVNLKKKRLQVCDSQGPAVRGLQQEGRCWQLLKDKRFQQLEVTGSQISAPGDEDILTATTRVRTFFWGLCVLSPKQLKLMIQKRLQGDCWIAVCLSSVALKSTAKMFIISPGKRKQKMTPGIPSPWIPTKSSPFIWT